VGLLAYKEGNFSMEPASHLNKETSLNKKSFNHQANVKESSMMDTF
jgi:hypothetical protein